MSAYSFSTDGYRNLHENFIHCSGPHMSNHPLPQPHGPSRRRPSYGGYQPSHGSSSHWNGAVKPGRFRGESRRFQPSYRPRDHHADHSESGYDNDKPRFGWGANYSHSQGYDPPPASLSRRDIMAERMFEPSESWKHDHVPDSDVGIYERFPEVRNRMPPPREDYTYPYGGDSFRGPYISRRGLPPLRQPNNYRPVYPDEGRWNSSYSLDDTSNSWARQRSPSSTSRPPRGRLDYRDVSYEKSLSGSPRSSRFSSPRQSRATASRRAHSPSSSSIRSSRERSKSPPRSPERSRSSVRSSVDSRSYTAEPPVRVAVQRSHPVGQFRGRGRGNQRFGMRFPADGFRDSIAPPFAPPLPYSSPNEPRPEDRPAIHPSLPQRPSPPYLTPGPSGQPRLSERGFTGPVQSKYHDSQVDRGSPINPDAAQQGNQLGKSKRKRRGGVNRKKQGNQAASVGDIDDPNASPSPSDGLGSVVSHIASPVDEVKAPVDLSFPVLSEAQATASAAMEEIPRLTPPGPEIEPPSAAENEVLPSTALVSERFSNRKSEAPAHVMADTSSPGATCQPFQGGDKGTSPVIEVITELPKLVIPPLDTPIEPPPARDDPHEVTKADSPSRSLPALSSPVPVANTTHPLPLSEPSFRQCSPPRFLPISGLPGATASSPVSSTVPTPSLQTPSPPYVDPVVVFAAPTVKEPEDDLMPASPVSSALQAVGVPTIVRPDLDTFSANAKEAESLTEALHMVVSARQQLDVQTREERVNPILMSNRAIAPPLRDVPTPSTDTLVHEVLAGRRVEITIQAFESHVRDSLVANLASRQETVDEKIVQLRREYLALHKEWVTRCAELDNSHRIDPAAGEVAAVPTRTTRRSAAVLGDAVRSDLEMEQIIASLGNDELYDPAHLAMRNLAAIPDMISVSRGKVDAVFDDTNNSVDDPQSFFDPSPGLAEWTDDEVEIYKQRFAKYPKQFGHIAVGLTHKTQAQCVQFYYLHKKALIDFREAITTYGQSKRRRGGRRTDKKKGGLLADIRQHDAEVSKGQDSVKRRPGAVGRRRRESARVAPRRSSTAVQQEEQTPVTTPTPEPEPEPVRPKRRRNPRPAPEPEPGSVGTGTGTGTEEPPPKRSRRGPRKPKIVPVPEETSTPEPKPLSKPAIEAPSPSIEEIAGLFIAQYGKDLKRIAASLSNKTTIQVGNRFASDLEGFNLSNIAAEASEHTPLTPDPPPEDKNDSSELLLDVANGKQDRSFTIGDVPPMSATSRSHLIDLQSLPFSIPGSSTGSTLRLYS